MPTMWKTEKPTWKIWNSRIWRCFWKHKFGKIEESALVPKGSEFEELGCVGVEANFYIALPICE